MADRHIAAGGRPAAEISSRNDAVGDHRMFAGGEPLHAFNGDNAFPGAFYFCAAAV